MSNLYSPESDAARRRRLDELFADEPYLSPTMKARRLTTADEDAQAPPSVSILAKISEDDILRRLTAARHQCLDSGCVTDEDDPLWIAPLSLMRDPIAPQAEGAPRAGGRRQRAPERRGRAGARASDLLDYEVEMDAMNDRSHAVMASRLTGISPDIMTVREAADYLRVGERAVREWVKQAQIPHARLGRHIRFRRAALQDWLASLEKTAA